MTVRHDPRYLDGVRLFNRREFFECHDVLEELWTELAGDDRDFYQGLIQAAVALFHFGEGNLGGARKLYRSAKRYLAPYRPEFQRMDVDRFLADFDACFRPLASADSGYPTGLCLDEESIPRIRFVRGASTP